MEIGPEPDSTPAAGLHQLTLGDRYITRHSPIAESTGLPILSDGERACGSQDGNEIRHLFVVSLRFVTHPVGYVFADHDAGEVDVRAGDRGHDRRIDHPQVRDGA